MELAKNNLFNKTKSDATSQLNQLKDNIAVMAESRAAFFKQNINQELQRLVNSLLGLMLIFAIVIFAGLIGMMWLFASAWNSPNRDAILGSAMLLPILFAIGIFLFIRYSWLKDPLFSQSIAQIESDWHVFRAGFKQSDNQPDE
jgi:uncharacterized membrane protein YqjE